MSDEGLPLQIEKLVSFPETGLRLSARRLAANDAAAPAAPHTTLVSSYDLFGVANHSGTLRYVIPCVCGEGGDEESFDGCQ